MMDKTTKEYIAWRRDAKAKYYAAMAERDAAQAKLDALWPEYAATL